MEFTYVQCDNNEIIKKLDAAFYGDFVERSAYLSIT